MMFALARDVFAHFADIGFRHRECAETALPRKIGKRRALRSQPFGGPFFNGAHNAAQALVAREAKEDMHMVVNAANHHRLASDAAQHAAHIAVQFGADVIGDARGAVFDAEYAVHINIGERLRHGGNYTLWIVCFAPPRQGGIINAFNS